MSAKSRASGRKPSILMITTCSIEDLLDAAAVGVGESVGVGVAEGVYTTTRVLVGDGSGVEVTVEVAVGVGKDVAEAAAVGDGCKVSTAARVVVQPVKMTTTIKMVITKPLKYFIQHILFQTNKEPPNEETPYHPLDNPVSCLLSANFLNQTPAQFVQNAVHRLC